MSNNFKSGFISVIGRANVGKSTLTNCFVGEKISIISSKPQTTRNKITAILTRQHSQMVFIDTPGIHTPKHKLGEYMVNASFKAAKDVDVILFMVEPNKKNLDKDDEILKKLQNVDIPVILVINKIDTVEKSVLLTIIDEYKNRFPFKEIIPISALKAENTLHLLEIIEKYLEDGPMYFPGDMITDQPEKQIVAEIIREKLLQLLQEEIPHGTAVSILSMKKRDDKDLIDIEATIFCEKESHKGIVIGKKGAMLKEIGTRARHDIVSLLGTPVNLKLWVKVKERWRDSDFLLKNFGYNKKDI